jgi:glycosyltransferase involved in cell wall biosynthesis
MPARDFLFLQSTTEIGGAESNLLNLFAASEELRVRSVIANLGFGSGNLPQRLRAVGAEVIDVPRARLREPLKLAETFRRLRAIVRDRGCEAIVANGAHPQIIGGTLARLTGTRSVFLVNMIHNHPWYRNRRLDALAMCAPCDLYLTISEASRQTMAKIHPGVPARLHYWGTPVRPVDAAVARDARRELGAADGHVLFGSFGRLQRWKGQDVFVTAAAEVARARPQARFVVVGGSVFGLEPEYFAELRQQAARLGLGDRLRFTGFRQDVPRLMAACDVVCHTSRVPEPFGLVIIEAMALGRAVVATAGGGPSEIVASPDDGVLVPPESPSALAEAMIQLHDSPDRRALLGRRGADRVQQRFTIEAAAADLLSHLDPSPRLDAVSSARGAHPADRPRPPARDLAARAGGRRSPGAGIQPLHPQ